MDVSIILAGANRFHLGNSKSTVSPRPIARKWPLSVSLLISVDVSSRSRRRDASETVFQWWYFVREDVESVRLQRGAYKLADVILLSFRAAGRGETSRAKSREEEDSTHVNGYLV